MLDKEQKCAIKKNRLQKLEQNGKNIKSTGVVRKLRREIRNMDNI
jgi:hypothetical protein